MRRLSALRPAVILLAAAILSPAARADVTPASLFAEHMVLQQGMPLPVWGTAPDGERVTVEIAGQRAESVAADGRWRVTLAPLAAGGPHVLTIAGQNRIVIPDVLVGEVWLCSGQSNMEMKLGPGSGLQPVIDWQPATAAADLPQLRYFGVPRTFALEPRATTGAQWRVCSPASAPDMSAVAFFFGRALARARGVPIGLVHSSWGGSFAEAWMSRGALEQQPDFAAALEMQRAYQRDPAAAEAHAARLLAEWYRRHDPGSAANAGWEAPAAATADWPETKVPALWEQNGLPDFDGVAWLRREVDLPADWAGQAAVLHLGPVDDADTTWVNGQLAGAMHGWDQPRHYSLPAGLLKAGRNVIAVRVLDTGGGGGLWGNGTTPQLVRADGAKIDLSGTWRIRPGVALSAVPAPPRRMTETVDAPGALFNGMIAPLVPYAMRGVIWYQGESNSGRPKQYRTLFPALIADWRARWDEGGFPFLFVQIAPWKGMKPEIREAQLIASKTTPNTAMVVTLDVGDAKDIHPPHKQPVGERLALAARALAYGEQIEYSGPVFETAEFAAGRAVVKFSHADSGLVAPGGKLLGFTLAGADGVFHPAEAAIVGRTLEVRSAAVPEPTAVRYAWDEAPSGNLFNGAGLPASPFRSDVE